MALETTHFVAGMSMGTQLSKPAVRFGDARHGARPAATSDIQMNSWLEAAQAGNM